MRVVATSYKNLKIQNWQPNATFTIVAGENGCGKSSLLLDLAARAKRKRQDFIAISGTPHHRFGKLRLKDSLLAQGGRRRSGAEHVLKLAMRHAIEQDELQLRMLSRTLRHCGFWPVVGIEIVMPKKLTPDQLRRISADLRSQSVSSDGLLHLLVSVINHYTPGEVLWIDFDSRHYGHSIETNYTAILIWEQELKRLGVIRGVRLHLRREGREHRLAEASSGELSLITSLAFLAVSAKERKFVFIDEPENSLHPRWQREYIDLLYGAIGYSGTQIVVATHSPLIVMAATELDADVDAMVLSDTFRDQIDVDSGGLEKVMAEVFHTFTPRNNYLSRALVEIMDTLEDGAISAVEAKVRVRAIEESGVDRIQGRVLGAVDEMIDKIEALR
ncbi:ATP-binding protein [Stenotrophomonas geniculata]|uniref:ATP-binding protein n=1 Tax=Stenotrophomonas geniculata TaxID=86188 RepID=UPI002E76BDD6|nr:ATP-binding protein [Stenotrophomonas geniculata]